MRCDRCGREARYTVMSRFNTQILCDRCEDHEREHPKYAEAAAAELEQVRLGNLNFEGVGLPDDFEPLKYSITVIRAPKEGSTLRLGGF